MNLNQEITLSDLLGLYSIYLSFKNLELNLTQNDKEQILQEVDANSGKILDRIEQHLINQDKLLREIKEQIKDDYSGDISKDKFSSD